jgi:hypothetical protein
LDDKAKNKDGNKSLVMEAIVTKDLWTWHVFIGLPGSSNDINVVDYSPFMVNYLCGVAHAKFTMKQPCPSHMLPLSKWHIS